MKTGDAVNGVINTIPRHCRSGLRLESERRAPDWQTRVDDPPTIFHMTPNDEAMQIDMPKLGCKGAALNDRDFE
jgi:hypothetical protein